MAQTSLVDRQIEEGHELVEAFRKAGHDVSVALWLKTDEEDRWHLYVASKSLSEMEGAAGYRTVDDVIGGLPSLRLDLFDVRIIDIANPLVKEVSELQSRSRGSLDAIYRGPQLGNLPVEEAFIYAPLTTT